MNRVLGLKATPKDLISRVEIPTYPNVEGEEVEHPINYMKSIGGNISLIISGDIDANFDLVVQDITNTKWYNWETNEFTSGYSSKQGVIDYSSIDLIIPPQTSETKYQIFFNPIGSANYSKELPTEVDPWFICQLMDATTTFKFDDRMSNFISDTIVSKTYAPGAVINTNESGFKVDITITVLPKRGLIKLLNEDVSRIKVNPKLFNTSTGGVDNTSILTTDLIASVDSDYSTGTISGTITPHKSAIRDYDFSINPNTFFKII